MTIIDNRTFAGPNVADNLEVSVALRNALRGRSVVQVNKAYAPRVGGVETVVRTVAEGLGSLGLNSAVIVPAERGNANLGMSHEAGVTVTRVRTLATFRSMPISTSLGSALRKSDAEVFLAHEPSIITALANAGGKDIFGDRPLAVWWHFDVVRQKRLWKLAGPSVRKLLERADRIAVATPHHISVSTVLPQFSDKCVVIPFGIDLGAWRNDSECAAEHQVPDEYALFVGRLVYYKGVRELLQVVELLPGKRFVVVGEGPLDSMIRAHPSFQTGQLTLLPHVSNRELAVLMRNARVLAFPSSHNTEAFGIVQIQAMALGVPVVSFDLPTGVSWVNQHERTGFVVPLGNHRAFAEAIGSIMDDPVVRGCLGAQGRKRADSEFGSGLFRRRVVGLLFPSESACL